MDVLNPIRVRIDPQLVERAGLNDVLCRLAWAGAGESVEVVMDSDPPSQIKIPEALSDDLRELCEKLRFTRQVGDSGGDFILVQDEVAKHKIGKYAFVLNRFERTEGNDLTRFAFVSREAEIATIRNESRRRFEKWAEEWGRFPKSYLIATGPSFDQYTKIKDFDEAFVVTCNSAVIDPDFMAKARPSLVVFGDPIFHFGPSRYAAEFRSHLRIAAAKHEFRIAVMEKYYYLFRYCFPELMERTVFVQADGRSEHFHWGLESELKVKGTRNILTLLMLPLAACFSQRLEILGCDGRRLVEDGYFWGHSKAAQINDRMQNIQEAHPGFFAIDYNDYYLTHCQQLEQFLTELECGGIKVVSAAPSCIPALAKRAADPVLREAVDQDTVHALLTEEERRLRTRLRQLDQKALSDLRFVSVNPSLRGGLGHGLYQDLAIRAIVSPDESGFISLGDAGLEEALHEGFALPVFNTKIWKMHRRSGKEKQALAESFVAELFSALEQLNATSSLAKATLFFYMGHPALLPAFVRKWKTKQFQCHRFVFNLFSGFFEGARVGSSSDAVFHSIARLADYSSGFDDLFFVGLRCFVWKIRENLFA